MNTAASSSASPTRSNAVHNGNGNAGHVQRDHRPSDRTDSLPSSPQKAPWQLPSWDVPDVRDSITSRGVGFKRMDEDFFDPLNQAVASVQHSLFPPLAPAIDVDGDTAMVDVDVASGDAWTLGDDNNNNNNDKDALDDLLTLASIRAELAKTAVARTHLSMLTSHQEQSQETHERMQSDQAQRATLAAIESRQAKVTALERQLDEKIEYERQMADVRKVPSRDETRRLIEAYEREINGLKDQLEAREASLDKERRKMYRAMNAILELKEGLAEARAEREAMRREIEGQEKTRPGKGQQSL